MSEARCWICSDFDKGDFNSSGKRHPTIGDNVIIGADAKLLGPLNIGEHTQIGAGTILTRDMPSYSVVVGNPGRVIKRFGLKVV